MQPVSGLKIKIVSHAEMQKPTTMQKKANRHAKNNVIA